MSDLEVPTRQPTLLHIASDEYTNMPEDIEKPRQPFSHASLASREFSAEDDYMKSYAKYHYHKLSDSTNTTTSNESSPTTTISTVDDSSATEPSPGSSPESPPPTSSFPVGMIRPRTADDARGTFFEMQKQPLPRKGRNLKNLAVNTSGKPVKAPTLTSLPLRVSAEGNQSVLSPSFVKPPTPPRRRPSALGLTILTPGLSKAAPQEVRLAIPPTPGVSRPAALRHFQSSPSLPLVTGLSLAPSNLKAEKRRPQPLDTLFSPLKQSFRIEEEEEQNFDIPLSREEKPEAYPDGPICVYNPGVDLYLEPTAAQASTYDVIFNVASEVRNPFVKPLETPVTEPDLRIDGGGGIQYAPKRTHLLLQKSDEAVPKQESSPTTPKATPSSTQFPNLKEPEYHHILWEHNSDIVPDLLRLCKIMDERVSEGKRVLVHCQCGVSRSASLVVAYGLFKAPHLSVQEAYDAVKARSKWIGPNMNLIMQLQEFRSSLANGGRLASNRGSGMSPITPSSAFSEWRLPLSARQSQLSPVDVPSTAAAVATPANSNLLAQESGSISPGPSSAPSGVPWPSIGDVNAGSTQTVGSYKSATAFVDPSGHVLPVSNIGNPSLTIARPTPLPDVKIPTVVPQTPIEPLSSPRSTEFAMLSLQPPTQTESADTFGLMSPTAAGFGIPFFDRSALLASLGMGSMGRDEDTPRRSLSNRSRQLLLPREQIATKVETAPRPLRTLRKKISAPSIREQEQLQSLQAKIKASLPARRASPQLTTVDEALLSPRATEFTKNPFALQIPERQPRPHDILRPQTSDGSDPRSPAHSGAHPIIRNILDVL